MKMQNIQLNSGPGPGIWNFFNALAFLILLSFVFVSIFHGLSYVSSVAEIKKNWKKYRCEPSIMPFASLYGYNTSENFNYCMGNIFTTHSSDMTGSFTSVIGDFTSVLSVILGAVNSIRTSVATLGGGINVVFQDFTDRITTFFFQLRLSAIHIKMLIQRMYATLFAVMYMGLSGVTGVTNFSNTVLFSFIDTFCFPPNTLIRVMKRGLIPISDVLIGDILLPTMSKVTAKFHFSANGQAMVSLPASDEREGRIFVSTNHYIKHNDKYIRADEHPDAVPEGPYAANSLVCLNTDNNIIPIDNYQFRDYDETSDGNADENTMSMIEKRINTLKRTAPFGFKEYYPSIQRNTRIKLVNGGMVRAKNIHLGDELSTGAQVIGIVQRQIREFCIIPTSDPRTPIYIASSTLIWCEEDSKWHRAGDLYTVHTITKHFSPSVFISLFVSPNSQIELENGLYIRDSMELFSPDAEVYYAEQLKQLST